MSVKRCVWYNVIQYVTVASTGNATDFGDLSDTRGLNTASASSTRAVFAGGIDGTSGNAEDVIDYVTISSTGNATDFGNLTESGYNLAGVSSGTRAVFGLRARDAGTNVMDYITIASTGKPEAIVANISFFISSSLKTDNISSTACSGSTI